MAAKEVVPSPRTKPGVGVDFGVARSAFTLSGPRLSCTWTFLTGLPGVLPWRGAYTRGRSVCCP